MCTALSSLVLLLFFQVIHVLFKVVQELAVVVLGMACVHLAPRFARVTTTGKELGVKNPNVMVILTCATE